MTTEIGGSESSTLLAVLAPDGSIDYNWFISKRTLEPIYNWHYSQDHPNRPEVPEHVLAYAEKLKAEHGD